MKRIFILFGALALAIGSQAQMNQHSNYFGLNVGGGMNTLMYNPSDGTWNLKLGFLGELKYMHFFGKHFGMGIGAQFDYVRSGATYDWTENLDNAITLTHPNNNLPYHPHVGFNDWKEIQTTMVVSVPVELYWRALIGERWFFLLGLGAQLDLPLKSSFKANDGSFSVAGQFDNYGPYDLHDLPEYGFDTYKADEEGDIENLKEMGVSLIADLGFNYALNEKWGLYFGLYGTYGLTNLIDQPSDKSMLSAPDASTPITPGNPPVSDYNGIFNSTQIDEAHLVTVGAKIGINLGWQCHPSKRNNAYDESDLVSYDNNNNTNAAYGNDQNAADEAAQAVEEAAAREARCNARRMNNPDLASALSNIDSDIAEAEQAANESGDANAKASVARAKALAEQAKEVHRRGKYCLAYDLFNEAYGEVADSYADDADTYAKSKNLPVATQAAEDAALYAEASHKDGLDCAMAASRNAKINSEIARDADKADRGNAAYNDPSFASRLAQEAIDMANETGSKPALTDGKDAAGKAYRGNLPECYAAAAKSFAESGEACAAKNNTAEAKAAVKEAKQYASEAAEAARMGNTAAAYRAAVKARDAAQRACGITPAKPANDNAAAAPISREHLQALLDQINATVHFDFAKTDPKFDAATDLAINTLCKAMAADKSVKVLITGHTDNIGSAAGNMTYGKKRAEALKSLMVKRGAPASSISTASKGQTEPVVDNDTDEHRYQNRRAVVTLR